MKAFLNSEKHVSVEELNNTISRSESKIGLATVYRTLTLLTKSGLASEMDFGDGSNTANMVWDMGWDGSAFYPGGIGAREYIFIHLSDYNGGIDYNDDNSGPSADVVWAIWPANHGTHPYLEAKFSLFFIPEWLSTNPTYGVIPANSSQNVTVTFDATNILGGDYPAEIIIVRNDNYDPDTINVSLTVQGTKLSGVLLAGTYSLAEYQIIGDITITSGDTVILEAGTEFLFDGQYNFNIYGTLKAIGTESDSIIFD